MSKAALRKRNASIEKYHKNAKINFMKAQEKLVFNINICCFIIANDILPDF